jgi:hypothetical protein
VVAGVASLLVIGMAAYIGLKTAPLLYPAAAGSEVGKDLEDKAMTAAINGVRSGLDTRTEELSKRLEDTANSASTQLQGSIEDAQKRIRDANFSIAALAPQIERLKLNADLVNQMPKIMENLDTIASSVRYAQMLKNYKLIEGLPSMQNVLAEWKLARFSSLQLHLAAAAASADGARLAAQRATDAFAAIEEDRKRGAATVVSLKMDARPHMDTINRLLDGYPMKAICGYAWCGSKNSSPTLSRECRGKNSRRRRKATSPVVSGRRSNTASRLEVSIRDASMDGLVPILSTRFENIRSRDQTTLT